MWRLERLLNKSSLTSQRLSLKDCRGCQPSNTCTGLLRDGAGAPSLHCTKFPRGVPHPCVFCKGGRLCCRRKLLSVRHYLLCMPSSYPPFAKYAKDVAPASVV